MKINVVSCRHEWPEKPGFCLDRPRGLPYYIFIHFKTPVTFGLEGRDEKLSPGACVVCPPNTWSCIRSEGRLIHDWMHLSGDVAEALSRFSLECGRVYYVKDSADLSRTFQSIERELYSDMPYKNELIEMKLYETFIQISRETFTREATEDIASDVYEAFKKLRIDAFANIADDPNVAEMAKRVHLSESRFYVLYKQIFGISPKNDLIIARIERAKSLLEENMYNNAEIAAMTGYTNEYHFIRQFKKIEGMTPKEYARLKAKAQLN